MKTMILVILSTIAFAGSALAASYGSTQFGIYSSAAAGVKTSSAFSLRGYSTKSIQVEGVTLTSNAGAVAFQNMSGTLIAQCSQDGTSWETCIANDYAQTTISRTSNGIFTWRDAFNYVRIKWTAATTGHKIKAWLSWVED